MQKGDKRSIVDGKKECRVCKKWKSIEEFSVLKNGILFYRCKECQREYNHSKKGKEAYQKYYGSEKHQESHKREVVLGKSAERRRRRRKEDPLFKLITDFRTYINQKCSYGRKHCSWEYLGCSWNDFKEYIESQFDENMTWANKGAYWHLDHIIPCSYFDLSIEENLYICWNWRNFQPLKVEDNLRKSNNLPPNYEQLLKEIKEGV